MTFQPIENYGIIGNLCTVALVGTDSSIDFFCFPEFDSPTVFAALLLMAGQQERAVVMGLMQASA